MTAQAWEAWRTARDTAAAQPYGVASLDRTVWLDGTSRDVDGLPGRWRLDGSVVVGEVDEGVLRIEAGQDAALGDLRLRNFSRAGTTTLRVFDPASPHRTTLEGIEAYPYDEDWVVTGPFHAAADETYVDVTAVDGVVSRARLAGTITLPTPAGTTELTVTQGAGGGLSAVLADATNGVETYRFRFLEVGDVRDGEVTVDFNRAHLPPCAFSPEYVCPLPLPGNRWTVPVRAGERTVRRLAA